jgi:hypothetical protein
MAIESLWKEIRWNKSRINYDCQHFYPISFETRNFTIARYMVWMLPSLFLQLRSIKIIKNNILFRVQHHWRIAVVCLQYHCSVTSLFNYWGVLCQRNATEVKQYFTTMISEIWCVLEIKPIPSSPPPVTLRENWLNFRMLQFGMQQKWMVVIVCSLNP